MGHGIAQVSMTAGINVMLYDLNDDALTKARDRISWSLDKLHEKGRIDQSPADIMPHLSITTDLDAAVAAQQIIEVVPERESIKKDLFAKLDDICDDDVIFTTNTSAIPITKLAAATRRPDRFCGTHFFIPVQIMKLVEVIRGEKTSDATVQAANAWVRQIGKEPVLVQRDISGFLVNRILMAAMVEAINLHEQGYASADDIDKAMKLGCNWPMGPLQLIDYAGLDVVQHTLEAINNESPHPKFDVPELLKSLVAGGKLGAKSGGGFHDQND